MYQLFRQATRQYNYRCFQMQLQMQAFVYFLMEVISGNAGAYPVSKHSEENWTSASQPSEIAMNFSFRIVIAQPY